MLYDFLCNNGFEVGNFNYDQSVSYTYFNAIVKSYIDHVFVSGSAKDLVTSCCIQSDMSCNVSDHFPICTNIVLNIDCHSGSSKPSNVPIYPRLNWSDDALCQAYSKSVNAAADTLDNVNIDSVQCALEASEVVDTMCKNVINIMHQSCNEVLQNKQSKYKGRYKQHNWWNNDYLVTRNRQRFWFAIWKSCGRPRTGQVYMCYKSAKKQYRLTCTRAMNGRINNVSSNLNNLYTSRSLKIILELYTLR